MFLTPMIKRLDFYCWIFICYLPSFQNCGKLVSSLLNNDNLSGTFLIHKGCSWLKGWHPKVFLTQPMDLSPKIHTIWYITLLCSLNTDQSRSGHPYVSFWRHKGRSWLLWIKSNNFLLLDLHLLCPWFQNCIKLVCSLFQCLVTESDGPSNHLTN